MKDYFLWDGGKLKKIGIKQRVRSERYKLLMKKKSKFNNENIN